MCIRRLIIILLSFIFITSKSRAQPYTRVDPQVFADNSNHWYGILDKKNVINPRLGHPKYRPSELIHIADNMLLYQKNNGGWPKNYDMFAILTDAQKDSLIAAKNIFNTTYDNRSTYTQIDALANIYTVTGVKKYKDAVLKGFDYLLASQYPNGGWPQYYPLEANYSRHITYNDDVFLGIMRLLKNVNNGQAQFGFLSKDYRVKLKNAYEKGMSCILKTQIKDNGKPTAWCQQHDEITLLPTWARKFEPPSICNQESASLVLFLMDLDRPSKEIVTAIQNAEAWFLTSEIKYTVIKRVSAPREVTPLRVSTSDRVVVIDSTAAPIWTRYYELITHRPLFCNRDSKVVYSLAEVERERRDGYAWYTYAPQKVIDRYPEWEKKWNANK